MNFNFMILVSSESLSKSLLVHRKRFMMNFDFDLCYFEFLISFSWPIDETLIKTHSLFQRKTNL